MKRLLLTILLTVLFAIPGTSEAQEVNFAATKNLFDLEVFAGDTVSDAFAIFNQSKTTALPMHLELSLWNLKEDSDDIEFVTSEPTLNAVRWFNIEGGNDFILEPDVSHTVRFSVSPPPDTPPGSYFVMMRFQAVLPEHYYQEQGPRFAPEIGVLAFIRVPILSLDGNASGYDASIESLDVKSGHPLPVLSSVLPMAQAGAFESIVEELTARIRNSGIFHFKASGTIEIKNMLGRTVARADIPEKYLVPNRSRSIDMKVVDGLSFWGKNFRFGPYRAVMTLDMPDSDKPVVETIRFWIFPWKTITALLLIAGFVVFGHGKFRRAFLVLVRGEKNSK